MSVSKQDKSSITNDDLFAEEPRPRAPRGEELPLLYPGTDSKRRKPPPKQKGMKNRIPADLKSSILAAAARFGENGQGKNGLNGYLFACARDHQVAYMNMLGRMIPVEMAGSVKLGISTINIVSIPSDHFLTADQAEALGPKNSSSSPKLVIDHKADEKPPSPEEE
jgi:hypothetical protein